MLVKFYQHKWEATGKGTVQPFLFRREYENQVPRIGDLVEFERRDYREVKSVVWKRDGELRMSLGDSIPNAGE